MPAEAAAGPPMVQLDDGKPFRLKLDRGGRVHVDRALPFLILNRSGEPDGLAARVTATSPAYVLWSGPDDGGALAAIDAVAHCQHRTHAQVLLISLYDLPRSEALPEDAPRLEDFTVRLSASGDAAAQAASACLAEALGRIEVDLRICQVEHVEKAWFEPGVEELAAAEPWLSHLSLGLPQTYRVPGSDAVYPQLLHELGVSVFDALLKAACAFLAAISPDPPASHRALGRRSFVAAARSIDRKLLRISTSFDFLLGVSPINSDAAYDGFKASKFSANPVFRYRPLTVDPDVAKRALYAIDLRRAEDPVLEGLFAEKRRELDQQLTMLASRNTPDFRYLSLTLYPPVESDLLTSAHEVLAQVPGGGERGEAVGASEVRKAARALIARYRKADPDFRGRVLLREDIPAGLMVSARNVMIAKGTRMPRHRLDPLLQHEVSIHLLTCVNGDAQGLKIFRTGLAGYEGVQEGLGVFAECAVGGLTRARLRVLAARVVAVNSMVGGASFVDTFRLLHDDHGFGARMAFNVTARIYRSGGLSKDAIYLRGFRQILGLLASGSDLAPFWYGKIAPRHVPVVEELATRGLLQAPRSIPEFLSRPDAQARIERMRTATNIPQLI